MVATDNLKHVTVTLFFWKMPFDQENRQMNMLLSCYHAGKGGMFEIIRIQYCSQKSTPPMRQKQTLYRKQPSHWIHNFYADFDNYGPVM